MQQPVTQATRQSSSVRSVWYFLRLRGNSNRAKVESNVGNGPADSCREPSLLGRGNSTIPAFAGAARMDGGTADKAGSFLANVQASRLHHASAGLYEVSPMRFNAGSPCPRLLKSLPRPREFPQRTCRSCRLCVTYHVTLSLV